VKQRGCRWHAVPMATADLLYHTTFGGVTTIVNTLQQPRHHKIPYARVHDRAIHSITWLLIAASLLWCVATREGGGGGAHPGDEA
jgi:hypothetical protein